MANTLYPKGKEKILSAQVHFLNDTLKAVLVPSGYSYSVNHEFLSDLGSTLNTAQTLATKTVLNGAFDAADVNFAALTSSTAKAVVLYKDTGTASTSPLIAYIDQITGFPFTGNGGDCLVQWDNGSNKIFSL